MNGVIAAALNELNQEIANGERVLKLARECGFDHLANLIQADLSKTEHWRNVIADKISYENGPKPSGPWVRRIRACIAPVFAIVMALVSNSALAGGGFWAGGGLAGAGPALPQPDPYMSPYPYYAPQPAYRPQPLWQQIQPLPPDRMTCTQFGNTVRCTQF